LATLILAVFQLFMAMGRIVAVFLLKLISKPALVLGSATISVGGTAIFLFGHGIGSAALGASLTGLSLSAIYPTVLAIAGDRCQRFAGTVFGALFATGLVGAFLAPSLAGMIGRSTAVHYGIIVPLVGTTMVAALSAAMVIRGSNAKTGLR
jgi:fucose permease